MDINGISNAVGTSAANQYSNINNNTDGIKSDFGDILNDVQSNIENSSTGSEDASLKAECKKFEAIFLKQILDESKMFSNIGNDSSDDADPDSSDDSGDSNDTSVIGDMLSESFANKISDAGGLGLADKLYSSIKQRYSTENKG